MKMLSKKQILTLHTALVQALAEATAFGMRGCWSRHWPPLFRPLAENPFILLYRQKQRS